MPSIPANITPLPSTGTDNAIEATRSLYEAYYRLQNISNVLKSFVELVSDDASSKNAIQKNCRIIRHVIYPAIDKIQTNVVKSGKYVSPIASVKVACDQNEREIFRKIVDVTNKFKTPDIQMLEHYLTPLSSPTVKRPRSSRKALQDVTNKKQRTTIDEHVPVPVPASGTYYSVDEFLKIVHDTKENSKERGKVILSILHKSYVPVKQTALYRLLKTVKEGKPVSDWNVSGRPPIANKKDIDDIAKKLSNDSGNTYGKKELEKQLLSLQKKKINDAGHVALNVPDSMNKTSLNNYMARLAFHPELSTVTSAIRKTGARYAAEHSYRAAFNFALLVAVTHFVEVAKEDATVASDMRDLPKETRILYDLVTKARGGPVVPLHPAMISSTDDTTQYMFAGSKDKADKFYLVSKKSIAKRGTESV